MKELLAVILVCVSGCAASAETADPGEDTTPQPSTCETDCEAQKPEAPTPAPAKGKLVIQTNDLGPDNMQRKP